MKLHLGAIIEDGSGSFMDTSFNNMSASSIVFQNMSNYYDLGDPDPDSDPVPTGVDGSGVDGDDDILGDIFCAGLESQTNPETSFMICGCLTLVINTFGILGNCISLCILSTSFAKVSILLYLIGLSVCDTVMLVVDIFCFVLPVIFRYYQSFNYYTNILIPSIAPYAYPFADFGLTGSAYFTVAITIDRYIVCWPLEAKSSCTMKRARYSSILIILLSFLYNLPRFFEYTTTTADTRLGYQNMTMPGMPSSSSPSLSVLQDVDVDVDFDSSKQTSMGYQVKITQFGGSLIYKQWYLLFCWFIFIFIIPFVILFILNYLICRKVREANRLRRCLSVRYTDNSSSSTTKQSLAITYMSICLVVVFLACNTPFFINRIVQEFLTLTPIPGFVYTSNILISINSSVNWIIYCFFGKKFRSQFFRLLSCTFCCFKKDSSSGSTWEIQIQNQRLKGYREKNGGCGSAGSGYNSRRRSSHAVVSNGERQPSLSLNSFSTAPACIP